MFIFITVVQGKMNHLTHHKHLKETQLFVDISKLYRQTHQIFKRDITSKNHIIHRTQTGEPPYTGVIAAPSRCGIRQGDGEFLFIGHIRLGRAILQCAPRLEEFKALWNNAVEIGLNQCVLD